MTYLRERKTSFTVTTRDEAAPVLHTTINGLLDASAHHNREIIIVDDASAIPVGFNHPEVRIIRNDIPIGVAQSRRLGASHSRGDVLVWLDAHMRFAPDWFDQMLAHVDSGSVLCAAWWDYELSRPLCWGADYSWCGERDYASGRSPGLSFQHRTKFPGDGAVDVPMVIGACYMMLRETYETLGGFSPFFRIWGKAEQDLSTRAWIMGFGAKCVTNARVGHLSRSKFPYPVRWSDIEFNQLAIVRTVFAQRTAAQMEDLMRPLPSDVEAWASRADFSKWRSFIQSRRQISDAEFFRRFVPNAPDCLLDA
jgi:glycosyltransferase involved in cell wall biosynthesis